MTATVCTATPARSRLMFATLVACVVVSAAAEGALPTPRGYVNDFASVIDAQRVAQIDALVRETARTTSAEIVVVTVPTLDGMTVEEYASRLFAAWGIGKNAKNNGVLVLVAPSARAMRIEVGYGLEPVLPDGLAGEIIRTSFLPRFREGDYGAGIADGVARVVSIVREGKRAAPGTLSPTADSRATPLAFIFVLFLGLFVVAVGGFIAAVVGSVGFGKAGATKWRERLRGSVARDSTDWTTGSSSSSSDSSSGSSSSNDFGGGSSGGGGASGHW